MEGLPLHQILLVLLEILRNCPAYVDIWLHLGLLIESCGLLLLGKIVLSLIIAENILRCFILWTIVENVVRWLSVVSKGVLCLPITCSLLSLAVIVKDCLWENACLSLILAEDVIVWSKYFVGSEYFVGRGAVSDSILSISEQSSCCCLLICPSLIKDCIHLTACPCSAYGWLVKQTFCS